jgi:hypothetical protein
MFTRGAKGQIHRGLPRNDGYCECRAVRGGLLVHFYIRRRKNRPLDRNYVVFFRGFFFFLRGFLPVQSHVR